jgi:hypothetical protein
MMTHGKKRIPNKPAARPKKTSKKDTPSFDDLVLEGSLPRVKVRVFPSRGRSKTKADDQLVIELQCEV